MDSHVYPAEAVYHAADRRRRATRTSTRRSWRSSRPRPAGAGLWNLFLPHKTKWTDGPVEPRLRAAGRDHGPQPHRLAGLQLLGARHREHGGAHRCSAPPSSRSSGCTRCSRARSARAFAMTEPAVASQRRHQHRVPHRARRRRVRDQRPQVVDLGRRRRALQDLHPHGQDRSRRRPATSSSRWCSCPATRPASTIVRALPVFGYQDQEGHCEILFDDVRVPGHQPHRRGGRRVRHRPGPPRPRPHPPLHALHRRRRAGARADVPPGHRAGWRSAGRSPSRA